MKNKNTEKTEFLKIVYFDEAAAQDYVDVTNGGRLDWSTQENKEKIENKQKVNRNTIVKQDGS